ncbi:MAG: hypothetical protein QOF61_613 [Acidobacteriota bacterium]|nr:hypothetical protein [Acidobacteriota bacterium]
MNLLSHRQGGARARTLIVGALALFVWGAALVRASQVFAPDSIYVQPFNSDSALPVLMANDPTLDVFRTYIYGQDQIGAWSFLICQLIHGATGYVWTDRSVFRLQVFGLFLSVPLVAGLCRRASLAAGALLLAVICLHPTVSHYVFVLNQRYAWQLTALFFAWWSLRRLCARRFELPGRARTPRILWHLLAFFSSLLAVWTSPLSAPMLATFLALEVARARIIARDAASAARFSAARILSCALPLIIAILVEQLLKANYHRHALKHFGTDFRTPTQVDWGYLATNLRAQLANFTHASLWWLTLPALALAPFAAVWLLRGIIRRDDDDRAHAASRFPSEGARLDLCVLLVGSLAVASINFASAVVFQWIRLNLYGGRYLALTHLFGTFAGALALLLLLMLPPKVYAARRTVFAAVMLAIVLMLALKFPPVRKNPEYETLRRVAAGLAEKNPRAVLLGGYWDTYVFAALRPADAFTPVPAEDQLLRTPWTPRVMREADEVVVVHHVFPDTGEFETPPPYNTFGDGREPPPVIRQYGATLRLETPRWYEHDGYVFSLYRNVTDRTAR